MQRVSCILDVIDVDLALISKLERAFAIFLPKCIRLVDLCILREFSICLHETSGGEEIHETNFIYEPSTIEPHQLCTLQSHLPCHPGSHGAIIK